MDKLNEEENEQIMDVEIKYSDKEKAVKEEIERVKLEHEAEQKNLLKDRQTREKMVMFEQMMKNLDDGDAMKQYLDKNIRDNERELEHFVKKNERDKQKRIEEMEAAKNKKMQDLLERQKRMFNWEEQIAKDEQKHMDAF